ncbi:XRE family transcriptional regulator [Streptomyces longwoodensis]|uniref:XRE family transcriptional regulator n=1 Tax=Streptomyces longwoodensis TaxID=68231 RepID=UPI002255AC9E|nr:XRE family transcriptional regulator [Streptomyces longwoodensis]MCX4997492.1 XRE family transcriptional regulator [Streptomyces longwoodensis]WRY92114.1 XRE family transcriptional regulator [Streptomyces longwoodensis]WUC69902.1 XRE family transcriptional regulator [Streptomyces longwoodensis]
MSTGVGDAELEQILDGIGPRLRRLRRDRGLTLEALAAATGISVSTLSRVESGRRRPTLDLLIPLARAHHVALDQLVAAPASGDPRVHLRPVHKGRGSVLVPLTQYPGRVQVFKQVLAHREPELVTHEGYEWLYVLAGRLRLVLGARDFTLRPGEVAEFDTTEPHWFGPADASAVEILHLFGPRGDQPTVRTGPPTTDPAPPDAVNPPATTG